MHSNWLWREIAKAGPSKTEQRDLTLRYSESRSARSLFTDRYAWAVPTPAAIRSIKLFVDSRRILEIGSGLGLWARLLSDEGVSIVATDLKRSPYHVDFSKQKTWLEVERRGAVSAVRLYRDCEALMICWPPYNTPVAVSALRQFRGDQLIYIGEVDGGCTGDDAFHRLIDKDWKEVRTIAIPQWYGIHDELALYRRR